MPLTAISFDNVSLLKSNRLILDQISFKIEEGQKWLILGRNGAGKSSIVNLIFATLWPTSGSIKLFDNLFGNVNIQQLRHRIGLLQPQNQENLVQRRLNVRDILATGLFATLGYYSSITAEQQARLDDFISRHELHPLAGQGYSTLSAGEKRKVLFLRSLMLEPELVILDEPAASLDLTEKTKLFEAVTSLLRDKTVVLITHRIEDIPSFMTHAMLLKEGRILAQGKIGEIVTSENLSALYDMTLKVESGRAGFYLSWPGSR